jgi:hypothetical protein
MKEAVTVTLKAGMTKLLTLTVTVEFMSPVLKTYQE